MCHAAITTSARIHTRYVYVHHTMLADYQLWPTTNVGRTGILALRLYYNSRIDWMIVSHFSRKRSPIPLLQKIFSKFTSPKFPFVKAHFSKEFSQIPVSPKLLLKHPHLFLFRKEISDGLMIPSPSLFLVRGLHSKRSLVRRHTSHLKAWPGRYLRHYTTHRRDNIWASLPAFLSEFFGVIRPHRPLHAIKKGNDPGFWIF